MGFFEWLRSKLFSSSPSVTENGEAIKADIKAEGEKMEAEVGINISGSELNIPIKTTEEGLQSWSERRNDLNSYEREPLEGEILVDSNLFPPLGTAGSELAYKYYKEASRARIRGFNLFPVPKADYDEIMAYKAANEARQNLLGKTADLNMQGIALEKSGNIEDAIKLYEENIALGYPAAHAYTRLMVLYKRLKRPEDERRVILRAIEVYEGKDESLIEKWKLRLSKVKQ